MNNYYQSMNKLSDDLKELDRLFNENKKSIFEPLLNKLFIAMQDIEDTKQAIYLNNVLDSIDCLWVGYLLTDDIFTQYKQVLNHYKGCNVSNYSSLIRKIKEKLNF